MKEVFVKLLLLSFLTFTTLVIIGFLLPPYVGNVVISKKIDYLEEQDYIVNNKEINTLFMGSSTIYRHLNPIIFDKNTTTSTHSFNLGADATQVNEIEYILKKFLKTNPPLKKIIIAVQHDNTGIVPFNLHTSRATYYQDIASLKFSLEYFSNSTYQIKNNCISFLENQLSVRHIPPLLKEQNNNDLLKENISNFRGFFPFDYKFPGATQSPRLSSKKDKLAKGFQRQSKFKYTDSAKAKLKASSSKRDTILLKKYLQIKEIVEANNIEVNFLFFPNSSLFYKIQLPNSIYLGDAYQFPAYYDFDNWYNNKHLNSLGAEAFSKRLAEVYNETNNTEIKSTFHQSK